MPEYMINGIPVNFPFEPYSVQSAYMEKVLECLKKVYIYRATIFFWVQPRHIFEIT
jgi:hypothetical protein